MLVFVTVIPQPVYVNMNELANMAVMKQLERRPSEGSNYQQPNILHITKEKQASEYQQLHMHKPPPYPNDKSHKPTKKCQRSVSMSAAQVGTTLLYG